MNDQNIKKNVQDFYNQVGWQFVDQEHYQNARYEDLRPVARDYIHRCHLRVKRHLAPKGKYLLDAGSGPVQYPEYLTYSEAYQARVCVDISIQALKEARKRLGSHGYYVVADITDLPFKSKVYDGIVSLHTIHHIPMDDKPKAYEELYRTLNSGKTMVVVEGWTNAPMMNRLSGLMQLIGRLRGWWERRILKTNDQMDTEDADLSSHQGQTVTGDPQAVGTYVQKLDASSLEDLLKDRMAYEILVWRSVSVPFLRSVFHVDWGGRFWLKILFWFEERFPRFFGRVGQYPLIVVSKPEKVSR